MKKKIVVLALLAAMTALAYGHNWTKVVDADDTVFVDAASVERKEHLAWAWVKYLHKDGGSSLMYEGFDYSDKTFCIAEFINYDAKGNVKDTLHNGTRWVKIAPDSVNEAVFDYLDKSTK